MKRTTRSGHASTLVLLVGFTAAALALGGDVSNPVQADAQSSVGSGATGELLPVVTTGFTIGGDITRTLSPGRMVRMNLRLTNTTHVDLALSDLTVQVTGVSDAGEPTTCRPDEFVVRPAQLNPRLTLDARSNGTLRSLGLPRSSWPRIGLLNLPVNQNDCMGISLSLTYVGSARPVQI